MKILIVLIALFPLALLAGAQNTAPVIIGAEGSEIDACLSMGITSQKLNLRSGPGLNYKVTQILANNEHLHICGISKDGKWNSVVLAMDGILDCKVTSPVRNPIQYNGPCSSGWVYAPKVKITAG